MSKASRATASLLLVLMTIPAARAADMFTPSLSLATTYIDNIDLAPPDAPKSSDWLGQVVPRLQWEHTGPRLTGMLDYSAQILFFRDRSELNATHHNGTASGSWTASPDLFYVDGSASYTQQIVDPTQPRNTDNLFSVGNTTNELDAALAPYLKHDFGGTTGLLRYVASTARYSRAAETSSALLQNSNTGVLSAQYASNDAGAAFAWSIDGRSAHTTFDVAQQYRADRASVDGSLGVVSSLRLVAAVGAETNILEHSNKGGLDSDFWSAGFKWTPDARTSFEARTGHRFFGNSYSLSWTHESRILKLQSSYTEEPTTDSETGGLIELVPGSVAQAQAYATVLRSSTTYSPYIRKQFEVGIEIHGRRTAIALRGYRLHREFTDPLLVGTTDDTSSSAQLVLSRDIGDRTKLEASARVDVVRELVGFDYRDHRYAVDYTHQIGSTLTFLVDLVQLQRTGGAQYRANVATAKLQKTF